MLNSGENGELWTSSLVIRSQFGFKSLSFFPDAIYEKSDSVCGDVLRLIFVAKYFLLVSRYFITPGCTSPVSGNSLTFFHKPR